MQDRREAIKKYEPLALLIVGIGLAIGGIVMVLRGWMHSTIHGLLMIAWVLWFTKWAVQGGMPRGMAR